MRRQCMIHLRIDYDDGPGIVYIVNASARYYNNYFSTKKRDKEKSLWSESCFILNKCSRKPDHKLRLLIAT
eukprot:snap_masked-scaffold_17-processed-gene-5.11-mRNA-1 protein AED:1.00 eAED:1.00 QI:0/0/0/0/1/1/2/0/70